MTTFPRTLLASVSLGLFLCLGGCSGGLVNMGEVDGIVRAPLTPHHGAYAKATAPAADVRKHDRRQAAAKTAR